MVLNLFLYEGDNMNFGLNGKCALITGSTSGIGLATARALAHENAEVIINGRHDVHVQETVEFLRSEVPETKIRGIVADVATKSGCANLIQALPDVDILINNVGIFAEKDFEEITDEMWIQFFETNVLSGIRLSRHYLHGMRTRNWGRIVFVSSESAIQIPKEMIHYGMTKTAQLAISRGLAETLKNTEVTVNSILPGPTSSEGVKNFISDMAKKRGISPAQFEKDFFSTARPSSILQRFTAPEEVAAMICYVCSTQASGTTGAALRVDGGVVRAIT